MWIGNAVSFFGFQFTAVAVPVQMYAITRDSSSGSACSGIAGLVPLLVFGLWGGAVADAVDRRKLLLASSALPGCPRSACSRRRCSGCDSPVAAAGADRGAVGRVRDQLADPQAIIPRLVPPDLVPAANTLSYTTVDRRRGGSARWPPA